MAKQRRRIRIPFAARSTRFKPAALMLPANMVECWGVVPGLPREHPNPAPDFTGAPRVFQTYYAQPTAPRIRIDAIGGPTGSLPVDDLSIGRNSRLGGLFFYSPFSSTQDADMEAQPLWAGTFPKQGQPPSTGTPWGNYQGRTWTEVTEFRWRTLVNIETLEHFQFLAVELQPNQVERLRYVWFDSQNGLKRLLILDRKLKVRIIHIVWATRTLEWEIGGDGTPQMLHPDKPDEQYRIATNTGQYSTAWTDGIPSNPTLRAFLDSFKVSNSAQRVILAEQAFQNYPNVQLTWQQQTKWHRLRFPITAPTYTAATDRYIGYSYLPSPPRSFQYHTLASSGDYTASNAAITASGATERELTDQPFGGDVWCTDPNTAAASKTPNPTKPLQSLYSDQWLDRDRSVTGIRTSADALSIDPIGAAAWWVSGMNFGGVAVTWKATLENLLGPEGMTGGTPSSGTIVNPTKVSGWHGNTRPTMANLNYTRSGATGFTISEALGPLITDTDPTGGSSVLAGVYQHKRVFLDTLPAAVSGTLPEGIFNVYISETCQMTITFGGGWSGTITFTVRAWDGWQYSDPVTVSIACN